LQELTISYPPPGPFDVDCPALKKRNAVYRGKDQWEFYIAAAQLPDFLRGVAIHAGVDKFNADKTRDTGGHADVEAAVLPISVARAQSRDCDAVAPKNKVQDLQRPLHVVACMDVQFCLHDYVFIIV
jgi:hypothetical protein